MGVVYLSGVGGVTLLRLWDFSLFPLLALRKKYASRRKKPVGDASIFLPLLTFSCGFAYITAMNTMYARTATFCWWWPF